MTPPERPNALRPGTGSGAGASTSWTHAALQQQAQSEHEISNAIQTSLAHFGMDWQALSPQQQAEVWNAASHLPPEAPAGTRQEQLHAVLLRIQLRQTIARLSSQPQGGPLVIKTAHFLPDAHRPATSYAGVTVNGPHHDAHGNVRFYLERQQQWACADRKSVV